METESFDDVVVLHEGEVCHPVAAEYGSSEKDVRAGSGGLVVEIAHG